MNALAVSLCSCVTSICRLRKSMPKVAPGLSSGSLANPNP